MREWASFYIAEIILARPIKEWSEKYPYHRNALVAALCIAWTEEKIPRLKNDIGAILNIIFSAFGSMDKIMHRRMSIDTEKIMKEVKSIVPIGSYAMDLIERFKKWGFISDKKKPRKTLKKSNK